MPPLILGPKENAAQAIQRMCLTPTTNYALQIDHLRRTIERETRSLSSFQKKCLYLRMDWEYCKENRYFWMVNYAKTLDPHADAGHEIKLVPDLRYIFILNNIEEAFPRIVIAKSRQVFVTWLFVIMKTHKAMYRPARKIFFHTVNEMKAGFGGAGEPDTSCMLGRSLFVYDRLPPHLQTPGPYDGGRSNKQPQSLSFMHYDEAGLPITSTIYAVSNNPEIMAQFTATDILNDEVSLQGKANAKAFYGVAQPTLARRGYMDNIFTPRTREFGYDLLMNTDKDDEADGRPQKGRKELPNFTEIMGLETLYRGHILDEIREGKTKIPLGPRLHVRMNPNRNLAVKLWWRADPGKDQDWEHDVLDPLPRWLRQREYEIDFSATADYHPLWQIFEANEDDCGNLNPNLKPDDRFPLFRVWDFGLHAACLFCQALDFERPLRWVQARVLSEVDIEGKSTSTFARIVQQHTHEYYGQGRFAIKDICDVAGRHRSALAEDITMTHIKQVREATGIDILAHAKVPRYEGTETISLKILERVDGQAGFVINPVLCPTLSSAMQGGHIAMDPFGGILDSRATEWLVHVADALRYWSWHVLKLHEVIGQAGKRIDKPEPIDATPDGVYKAYVKVRVDAMRTRFLAELEKRRRGQRSLLDKDAY